MSMMACRGHRGPWRADPDMWPVSATFERLGHFLADDASMRSRWERTRGKLWGSFWANGSYP
eukprot:8671517-Alexandrium_andersonii.AAC.1